LTTFSCDAAASGRRVSAAAAISLVAIGFKIIPPMDFARLTLWSLASRFNRGVGTGPTAAPVSK
jgi:hypothetical protein